MLKHKTKAAPHMRRVPVSVISTHWKIAGFQVKRRLRERRLFYQVFIFELITSALFVGGTCRLIQRIEPSPPKDNQKLCGNG